MARNPKPVRHARKYAAAMARRYPAFGWWVEVRPAVAWPGMVAMVAPEIVVVCHHPGQASPGILPRKGARWS